MADEKEEAQRRIETSGLTPGDRYRHYKGGEYEVVVCAIKEDTLEPLVIYRSLEHGTPAYRTGRIWARTFDNWNEDVEVGGKRMKRFTAVAKR